MAERAHTVEPSSTRLTVVGSGDAFGGRGCNAACVIDDRVLVDCGAPVHALLPRIGMDVASLDLVLVTHFHADHIFMLPLLLGARAFGDEPRAGLTIAGPVGTREFVLRLLHAGYGRHLLDLVQERVQPRWVVLQDGAEALLAGYTIGASAVVHSTGPSLAYTVSRNGGAVIGFSGDSTLCAGLRRTVAASDVMVCECSGWAGPTEGGHLWRGELEQLIAGYPETRFLLTHMRDRGVLRGALIAHDMLSVDVSADRPSGDGGGVRVGPPAQAGR